jgi:hypothetical protein
MEITYDLILQYLTQPETQKNKDIFITEKNVFNYAINFPQKFKDIFFDNFYRYGVTISHNNDNISFWSSLLTLINKDFIIPFENDEITIINNFKNELIDKFSKKLSIKNYDKNDIRERMKLIPDHIIIQYLINVININIFIFDFKNEDINVVYSNNKLDTNKPIILLACYNTNWEPIMSIQNSDIQRIFHYNDPIIKKILSNEKDIKYYKENELNKYFTLEDENQKINKTQINKMKLDELINLAEKLEINILGENKKKLIKKEIIELIYSKLDL